MEAPVELNIGNGAPAAPVTVTGQDPPQADFVAPSKHAS